jgi:hypothetical protein
MPAELDAGSSSVTTSQVYSFCSGLPKGDGSDWEGIGSGSGRSSINVTMVLKASSSERRLR